MKLNRFAATLMLTGTLLGTAACDDDDGSNPVAEPTIVDLVATAEAAGSFSTLVTALEATNLRSTVASGGPFTVFAPTDAAFAALPAGTLDALLADPDALAEILLYHVVDGPLASGQVASSSLVRTLNGQAITIGQAGASLTVDGATIISADIEATNGIIHVIDQVILPASSDLVDIAVGDATFSTLVSVLDAAGLVPALRGDGPFTVFAPTDDAFAQVPAEILNTLLGDLDLLTQVLTYHVVPERLFSTDVVGLDSATSLNGAPIQVSVEGGAVFVNDATVIATDIQGTNGVIHVIDRVILPPDLVLN